MERLVADAGKLSDGGKVNLVTADGSVDCQSDPGRQDGQRQDAGGGAGAHEGKSEICGVASLSKCKRAHIHKFLQVFHNV